MKSKIIVCVLAIPLFVSSVGSTSSDDWKPEKSIEYICKHQNEVGTWNIGLQVNPDSGGGVTVGTTALACMALLDYWDVNPDKIKPVVEKGIKACLDKVWKKKEGVKDFESIAWGQLYTLQLLVRACKKEAFKENHDEWKKAAKEVLDWFLMRQKQNGGFGYTNSFHTAAAIIALIEVKDSGIEIKDSKIESAVKFLKSLDTKLGFRYSAGQSEKAFLDQGEDKALDDAAGRQAGSEWALFKGGKSDKEKLETAFQRFFDHRDFLWKTRALTKESKWPRNGGASPYAYFAFWGYYYSSQALAGVSDEKRKKWAEALKEDLMKVKEKDDTWINLPIKSKEQGKKSEYGYQAFQANIEPGSKIYATALALMALKNLK